MMLVLILIVLAATNSTTLAFSTRFNKLNIASRLQVSNSLSPITTTNSRIRRSAPLAFRVSETEAEVEVEEDVDFGSVKDFDLLQKLSKGVIPLAASVGFAVTPSSRIAFRAAGAAAGGILGFLAKSLLTNKGRGGDDDGEDLNGGSSLIRSKTVASTIEHLKKGPPLSALTASSLEKTAKKFRVNSKNLGELFTCVFSEMVFEATASDSLDLTELSEVVDFAEGLGLSKEEIGDGFALAANRLGRQFTFDKRGFFSPEYELQQLHQAAKLFFLGDKMIGSSAGYYGKRLSTSLLYFPVDRYKAIVSDACKSLFRRCIESVLLNPDNFSNTEVAQLQDFLTTSASASTLRPAVMQSMIMEAIQFKLDAVLSSVDDARHNAKLDDYESFVKVQKVLGWSSRELTATLEAKTMPLFEAAAADIVNQVCEKHDRAEELADNLLARVDDLKIDPRKARIHLTTLISEKNNDYMNQIDKVYNVSRGSVEPAFKIMVAYSHTHEALRTLTDKVMKDTKIPVPGLPFADRVRYEMFKMQLNRGGEAVKNGEMFDLTELQQQSVRKMLALPKITTWVTQCISERNFDENAKAAYQKLLREYDVDEEEWQSTAVDFYYQETEKVAQSKAIPSMQDMQHLSELKAFLNCSEDLVQRVNLELLGDKYSKAVLESMTPSGTVTEEYVEGLERLRQRLGLSQSDAENLLGFAARSRIGPIVKDLVNVWKSDTDATLRTQKEREGKKDKSGDPISDPDNVFGFMEVGAQKDGGGPNVFMREAVNLVDFYIDNYAIQGIDVTTDDQLRVNAVGTVPEADLVGMYKHYLITRLAEQDPVLRERYIKSEKLFLRVLGVLPSSEHKVKESLAYNAFKNMLRNVLKFRESVEPQDMQQFALLSDSLGLNQTVAERVLLESSRRALMDHAKEVFGEDRTTPINAEEAQKFRNQVASLGLDLRKDTFFSERLITYLYALEVQNLVQNGMETELQDVQEAYDIPEDRAVEIVEMTCKRYISQLLNLAFRASKRFDEQDSVRWTREIVKYLPFVSGTVDADGALFTKADKDRLIQFYQAEVENEVSERKKQLPSEAGAEAEETLEEALSVVQDLYRLINLTEDFVPPEQGIEGLLGNAKTLRELTNEGMESKGGKKGWAWG